MTDWIEVTGDAIYYSVILITLLSIEIQSKYNLFHSAETQEELDYAIESLIDSIPIMIMGFIGVCLIMFAKHSYNGLILGILFSTFYIIWLYYGFNRTMNRVAESRNLKVPNVFWLF